MGRPSTAGDSTASSGRARAGPNAVVALGASAGGLEALRLLFAHLPAETGLAFVVIQHLDPDRPSMLARVLEGVTRLQVVEVTSGMRLAPNRVHVIPSGSDLGIRRSVLALVDRQKTGGLSMASSPKSSRARPPSCSCRR